MAVIKMAVKAWAKVMDNPRQRNTEARSKRALRTHLAVSKQSQWTVTAATIDGKTILCKIDGHTRAWCWVNGLLDPPPGGIVQVVLIVVADLEEAKEYYEHYDSQLAVKRRNEIVEGICHDLGLYFESTLLRTHSFTVQLQFAHTPGSDTPEPKVMLPLWVKELDALDRFGMSKKYSLLIGTMLLTIRKEGARKAGRFFRALDNDEGTKNGTSKDGIEALARHMERRRADKRTTGYGNHRDMAAITWSAYKIWRDDRMVTRLQPASIAELYLFGK